MRIIKETQVKICNKIIEVGLLSLIIFTPIAIGTVQAWSKLVMEFIVIIMTIVWLLKKNILGEPLFKTTSTFLNIPMIIFVFIILIQLTPLPSFVLKIVAPESFKLYKLTLPDLTRWQTISVNRFMTKAELYLFLTYFLVFLLIINNISRQEQINSIVTIIILIGTFEAIYGMLEYLSGHQQIFWYVKKAYTDCVTGTYINRNHFAGYLEMAIPLTFGKLIGYQQQKYNISSDKDIKKADKLRAQKVILWFAFVIMFIALIISASRAGIVSLALSLTIGGIIGYKKGIFGRNRKTIISIGIVITCGVLWLGIGNTFNRFSKLNADKEARTTIWQGAVSIVKGNPLLGTGFGTFIQTYKKFKPPELEHSLMDHAHNDWLELITDTGIIGLSIVLFGLTYFMVNSLRQLQRRKNKFVISLALGGICGLLSLVFHSLTDFNLHIPANALLLSIILGLTHVTLRLKQ
ncbi:MAG: O-antigen ligase family protein [bacterium]